MFGKVLVPFAEPSAPVALTIVVIVACGAGATLWARRGAPDLRAAQRRWLTVLAGATFATALGYVMYIPAEDYYHPLLEDIGNRVNAFAALGLVLMAYATPMLAGTLIAVAVASPEVRRWAVPSSVTVTAVLAGLYAVSVRDDIGDWSRAADSASRVLERVRAAAPVLPIGTTVMTFGHPGFLERDLPVFGARWDLDAAVRVEVCMDLDARPMLAPYTQVACGRGGVALSGINYIASDGGRYGRVAFLDVRSGRSVLIGSRSQCQRELPRFPLGQFELPTLPGA
jgi:hypothetical protein